MCMLACSPKRSVPSAWSFQVSLGFELGGGGIKRHRAQQTGASGNDRVRGWPLSYCSQQHGLTKKGRIWLNYLFFVMLQHSPNSLAFTVIDWLIPRMNSSSYQSPWKTTRALLWSTGLGEMYTNIRLLLVVWNDNLKSRAQIHQRQVQSSVFCQQVNVMASVLKLGVQCASVSNSSHITLLSSHHVRIPERWAWCLVLSPRVRKALV